MNQATTLPFTLTYCLPGSPKSAVALDYGEVIIGRASDCQIIIEDAQASRRHTALNLKPQGITLTDLGSHNGTFINGKRLPAHSVIPLPSGLPFYIGTIEFSILGRGTPVQAPARSAAGLSLQRSNASAASNFLFTWRSKFSIKWLLLIFLLVVACLLAGVGGFLILWGSQPQHALPASHILSDPRLSLIFAVINTV